MDHAIQAQNLGKQFQLFAKDHPKTLQEAFAKGIRGLRKREKYWALRHIDFSVSHGHVVGIIGHNGAGKSTLLRLLSRVSKPDEGCVISQGRIGGLLELGTGFHPDLSGRDNVFINGVICGLTRQAIRQRFDDIVAFAELGYVIDDPLRTYSTGMRMRLGFAVAVHTDPEILLIDEVLAVGDEAFQQKCFQKIQAFRENEKTIILVSHNLPQIRQFCDNVIWLDKGQIRLQGSPNEVVDQYYAAQQVEHSVIGEKTSIWANSTK